MSNPSEPGPVAGTDTLAVDLDYRLDRDVDPRAIGAVYKAVGWEGAARDLDQLGRALRGSAEVASAWHAGRAVGVARMLSDGVMQAYINGVAVHPEYQHRGVGSRLVRMLIESNPGLHFHLRTRSRRFGFYGRLGFVRDETGMERFPDPPAAR